MITVKEITTPEELETAFGIRQLVFVQEQQVDPAEEYDEFETTSKHYLALDGDKAVGTARWRRTKNGVKLERFAVLKEYRSSGAGSALLTRLVSDVSKDFDAKIYLHAQWQVIPFYEKYGFETEGPEFEEAGIRHKKMNLKMNI